jgi:hypothetical protein
VCGSEGDSVTTLIPNALAPSKGPDLNVLEGYSAESLQQIAFEPVRWVVKNVVPEGLTLLGGKPKQGKSWLCLDIALSVASDRLALGSIDTGLPRDVLYVALEDNPRRLHARITELVGDSSSNWPKRLHLYNRWPRLDHKALDYLDSWREQVLNPGLVIFDTYQRVRPPTRGVSVYAEDYADLVALHAWATDSDIAVMLVHHHRKAEAPDDWIDALSGSTGMTGCVDTIAALFRERGRHDATLRVVGRDIDHEPELALKFANGQWTYLGDAAEYRMETTRARIVSVIQREGSAVTPTEVQERLGDVTYDNVKKTMARMAKDGELRTESRGRYRLPVDTTVSTVPESPQLVFEGDIGTEGTGS